MLAYMKRINVMVADEAKSVLIDYQNKHGYSTLDEAQEALLIEFGRCKEDDREW